MEAPSRTSVEPAPWIKDRKRKSGMRTDSKVANQFAFARSVVPWISVDLRVSISSQLAGRAMRTFQTSGPLSR